MFGRNGSGTVRYFISLKDGSKCAECGAGNEGTLSSTGYESLKGTLYKTAVILLLCSLKIRFPDVTA